LSGSGAGDRYDYRLSEDGAFDDKTKGNAPLRRRRLQSYPDASENSAVDDGPSVIARRAKLSRKDVFLPFRVSIKLRILSDSKSTVLGYQRLL
jgi:hypothetical protein